MTAIRAEELEDTLMRRWASQRRQRFFPDGVVDHQAYWATKTRVVFLLKEINVKEAGIDFDVRKFVRDGSCGATWNVVARWAHGFAERWPDWTQLPEAGEPLRKSALRSVATMNINKWGGGSTSKHAELRDAADRDRMFIIEQLRLLKPHVVVCGATADLLVRALGGGRPDWKDAGGLWHFEGPAEFNHATVVEITHPAARISHQRLYERLARWGRR